MKQAIRIIGGLFRGKKLYFPLVEGLRPTPDRIRETLFNWLMHDIRDALCLDAFAGSGALGFEAFSRGAATVMLLENNPTAHASLLKQAQSFRSPQIIIKKTDAIQFLQQTTLQFHIVFLDPPFAKNYLPDCIEKLSTSNILREEGLLYIESSHEIEMNPTVWKTIKLKKAGQVIYGLYQKQKGTTC
jgi:16S rRNA (guanine966-N2)-methyltransferase